MTRFRMLAIAVLALLVLLGALADPAAAQKKMAMILPGPVEDADFNALGYGALQAVGKAHGLAVSHSEKVAVADAERVAREYLGSGYSIVAFHGGQYLTMVQKLAAQFPDANFIIVSQGKGLPGNVWNIRRHFHEGFYPLGALAALATKTNKIAFISGIRLPDFIASLNAAHAAIKETNPKAEVRYAFVGDQNDPLKARQSAQSMLAEGNDVIISALNLGVFGVVEAVKASGKPVLVTSFYTDKHDSAPRCTPPPCCSTSRRRTGTWSVDPQGRAERRLRDAPGPCHVAGPDPQRLAGDRQSRGRDLPGGRAGEGRPGDRRQDRRSLRRLGVGASVRPRMEASTSGSGTPVALDGADFELEAGEMHALLGENGAGKTTLMNVLCGLYLADAGRIWLDGRLVGDRVPRDAVRLGSAWSTSTSS